MCDPRVASRHPPDSPDFGIVMPLYASHFHHARNFVWTHCALVEDARPVPIGFVLSSEGELASWNRLLLSTLETWRNASGGTCQLDWRLAHWQQIQRARDGGSFPLYRGCRSHSKYDYQTAKKLYGLLFFRFGRALVLDAEVRVLKRMSMRALFAESFRSPSYWYSVRSARREQNGLLAMDAANLLGHEAADTRAAYQALGVPEGASFLDVQHWWYDWPWLRRLAAKIESAHGNITAGVCQPPGTYDATLAFAFLFSHGKNSSCYPFYKTETILEQADLGSLVSQGRLGSGEALFQRYQGGSQTSERVLGVVDQPSRPILLYREWAGLSNEAADREVQLPAVRALVCRSTHLFLSVCGAPHAPYHCAHRTVRMGMPGMPTSGPPPEVPYVYALNGRPCKGVLSKNAQWRCRKHELE